jgi:hypothetical protein
MLIQESSRQHYCMLIAGILITVLGLSCTSVAPTTGDQSDKSVIAGKVLQVASAAKIIVEQGRPVDSAIIDPVDGYFCLSNLNPGTYRLKIIAQGYDTFSTLITVEQGYSYEFGNLALAELSENFTDTIPSIYDHYPKDADEIIYLPPDKYSSGSQRLFISISFDRPMNRASVERALSIGPAVTGGYFEWFQNMKKFNYTSTASTYAWDGQTLYNESMATKAVTLDTVSRYTPSAEISTYSVAKSFTFYFPYSGCYTDTTYTIRIGKSAVDTAGTPLDSELVFTFKTIQSAIAFSGIEMVPHNGDDWVPLISSGIQLTFPKRMSETSVETGVTINLAQNPIFLWTDYSKVNIYTGGLFVPDTTYIITIDSSIQDIEGAALGEPSVLSFRTAPIKISQTTPARAQIGVNAKTDITLAFNTYMDRTSIAPITDLVSRNGDTVSCWYNNSFYKDYYQTDTTFTLNQILIRPLVPLQKNMLYTLYLKPGAKDLNGYAMKTDYKLEFITMP